MKLYRKFVNTPGYVEIENGELRVMFAKRSHNPILKEAHLDRPTPPDPLVRRPASADALRIDLGVIPSRKKSAL